MEGKVKLVGFLMIVALAMMMAAGILGGMIGYSKGKATCGTVVETDTVYVYDTVSVQGESIHDTVVETKPVLVPYTMYRYDTIRDSVMVYLPMEWHHAHVPDTADIYYHGIMSAIDSMRFYHRNTVVTNNIVRTDWRMPRMTADIGAGALYASDKINPYLAAEVRYNATKTTWKAYGAVNHEGKWGAGLGVSYRINIIR